MKNYTQTGNGTNHYGWGTTGVGVGTFQNWNAAVAFPYNTGLGDSACAGGTNASFSGVTCLGAKSGLNLLTTTNALLITGGTNGIGGTLTGGNNVLLMSTGYVTVDAASASTSNYMNITNAIITNLAPPNYVSGFGSSAGYAGNTNGTSIGFKWNVGFGGTASSGVIRFANATANGWYCTARDITNPSLYVEDVASTSTTDITVTNYSRTTGLAAAWTSGDQLLFNCWGY
jgi:hypothetical protein